MLRSSPAGDPSFSQLVKLSLSLDLGSLGLPSGARVCACSHKLPSFVGELACQCKACGRIGAQAQGLASAVDRVVKAPSVGATFDEQQQVQACTIAQALARIAGADRLDGGGRGTRCCAMQQLLAWKEQIFQLLRQLLQCELGWRRTSWDAVVTRPELR